MSKLFFLWIVAVPIYAATFVGNGGNAIDLDLAVTLDQIHDTFGEIEDGEESNLCKCAAQIRGTNMCQILENLTKAQRKMCRRLLITHKKEMLRLSSRNSPIEFRWSDEPLKARSNGKTRIVDAVSLTKHKTIIIDLERFIAQKKMVRIALLTHELFHFIKIDGTLTPDLEPKGAFSGASGGKHLLDTLGTSVAMAAFYYRTVKLHKALSKVSKFYKKYYFELALYGVSGKKEVADKLLIDDDSGGTDLSFFYKPGDVSFKIGLAYDINYNAPRSNLDVEQTQTIYHLGAGYHIRPIQKPLSYWSQFHFSVFGDLLYGDSRYEAEDQQSTISDNSKLNGWQAGLGVHFPIFFGFWGNLNGAYRQLNYEYKKIGSKISDQQQLFSLGGSFGF